MRKVFALLLLGVFLFGCLGDKPENPGQSGYLQGHVSIGPLCPVERNPPDPNCLPNEETYKNYPFMVYDSLGSKAGAFVADADGNYSLRLRIGEYEVKQSTGLQKYSKKIRIESGKTTALDIDIDTGIR